MSGTSDIAINKGFMNDVSIRRRRRRRVKHTSENDDVEAVEEDEGEWPEGYQLSHS